MTEPKIYGVPISRSIGCIWACLELGIDYELVPIGWDEQGNTIYGDDYRRINPNARVPTLKDGDFVLWETLAINTYLAKKHGGPLAPRDLQEDALTMQWALWSTIHLERGVFPWFLHSYILDDDKRDPAMAAKALADLQPLFGVLEGQLAKGPYLLGDRFTIADLNLGCILFRPRLQTSLDLGDHPHLKDWDARVYARPAARRAWEIRKAAAAA
jgi:glutathione S-transferase